MRQALAAVTSSTSHDTRITLAEAIDHNVGLGPRWQGNLPPDVAMQHVDEVAALYARAVQGTLGARGTRLLPAPLAVTASPAGDRAWRGVVGAISSAARVRSGGPGFLGVLLPADAPVSQVPITIRASPSQLLVHTRLDHDALERLHGARFSTVIEVRLDLPYDSLRIAPANVPSAIAGHWLLGSPPRLIVSPDGVRVRGPGLDLFAHGPLILGWNLQRDPRDPRVTWLQALAFIHAVEGDTPAGKLRRPFSVMYPGEPTIVDFDLLLERGGAH